jgi:peptidoglycan/xylan/chitin deacetylase (PgdA/CDA1 family)
VKRSLLIKLPALLASLLILELGSGPLVWISVSAVLLIATALLLGLVCNPSSSFFAPTFSCARTEEALIALTFDDGPDPRFTPRILEILAEKKVLATFFVVGRRVRGNEALVKRIDGAGHLLGNHSDGHGLFFHFRLWGALRAEIRACNQAIAQAIGKEPLLFRSPQGFKNPALGDVLRKLRMPAIAWQVRGLDALRCDASQIITRIVSGVRPGGIVLLHDGAGLMGNDDRAPTIAALPELIERLRAAGFTFVRLDALLGISAYRERCESRGP